MPAASSAAPAAASAAAPPPPPLPATYRRLVAPRTGRSLREVASVVSAPTPAPGPGEVLLRVRYAGVNGGCETFRARGEHWFAGNAKKPGVWAGRVASPAWSRRAHAALSPGGFPLGAEGAGEVVATGEGVQLALGDAVTFVGVRHKRSPAAVTSPHRGCAAGRFFGVCAGARGVLLARAGRDARGRGVHHQRRDRGGLVACHRPSTGR